MAVNVLLLYQTPLRHRDFTGFGFVFFFFDECWWDCEMRRFGLGDGYEVSLVHVVTRM